MTLFAVFIIAAVPLAAGAMLSPAWPTAQPRIALAATLCLALVMGGAVFYAELFSWDTLVVDYILFALLSAVVLGGTLSTAQARAEAQGQSLPDSEQGWPGPEDLAFFAITALLLLIPLAHLPLPLGTAGQTIAFHSLATRLGGSFHSLDPLLPHTQVIVSPGLHALTAYLSQQLNQPIPTIHLCLSALSVFLSVWLAYDFGAELRDKKLGRALAIATLLCATRALSYLDGHTAELLALLFTQAFLLYALRSIKHCTPPDAIAAGLMLGAVLYTSLTISLIAILAFIILALLCWTPFTPPLSRISRMTFTLGIPLTALLGIAPWLINNWTRLFPISPSPFPAHISLLPDALLQHGIPIAALALCGLRLSARQHGLIRLTSLLMLLSLLITLDLTLIGLLSQLLPPLSALTKAPNLARHGPILPLSWFAGLALLHFWQTLLPPTLKRLLRKSAYPLIAAAALLLIPLGLAFKPIMTTLQPFTNLPPQTVTSDQLAAMRWIRDNTPRDSLLFDADGDTWLPIIAERPAVHFPAVSYFEWNALPNGADPRTADIILASSPKAILPDTPLTLVFSHGDSRVYRSHPSPP